jgi:hypothetical protein
VDAPARPLDGGRRCGHFRASRECTSPERSCLRLITCHARAGRRTWPAFGPRTPSQNSVLASPARRRPLIVSPRRRVAQLGAHRGGSSLPATRRIRFCRNRANARPWGLALSEATAGPPQQRIRASLSGSPRCARWSRCEGRSDRAGRAEGRFSGPRLRAAMARMRRTLLRDRRGGAPSELKCSQGPQPDVATDISNVRRLRDSDLDWLRDRSSRNPLREIG